MRTHTVVVLITIAILGVASSAMAKGGGGGGGGGGHGGHGGVGGRSGIGHGHFVPHFQFGRHFQRFPRNQQLLGGGWGWDWGYPGYGGNTSVLVSQQSGPAFPAADLTGSVMATPCHWNEETFNVPSSAGGKRPIQVVSCR